MRKGNRWQKLEQYRIFVYREEVCMRALQFAHAADIMVLSELDRYSFSFWGTADGLWQLVEEDTREAANLFTSRTLQASRRRGRIRSCIIVFSQRGKFDGSFWAGFQSDSKSASTSRMMGISGRGARHHGFLSFFASSSTTF